MKTNLIRAWSSGWGNLKSRDNRIDSTPDPFQVGSWGIPSNIIIVSSFQNHRHWANESSIQLGQATCSLIWSGIWKVSTESYTCISMIAHDSGCNGSQANIELTKSAEKKGFRLIEDNWQPMWERSNGLPGKKTRLVRHTLVKSGFLKRPGGFLV